MNTTTTAGVRTATTADTERLITLFAEAFLLSPVGDWLIPDVDTRYTVYLDYFAIFIDHALQHGTVHATANLTGAAIWYPRTAEFPEPDEYEQRLANACGPWLPRFIQLDEAFTRCHPTTSHHHLAIIAVDPDHQRQGIGSALLNHHHAEIDRQDIAAYLEASNARNRDLYLRHGYTVDPAGPFDLPDGGPPIWPMWRSPTIHAYPPNHGAATGSSIVIKQGLQPLVLTSNENPPQSQGANPSIMPKQQSSPRFASSDNNRVSRGGLDVVYFGLFDDCNAKCNMCNCWILPRSKRNIDHYRQTLDAVLALKPRSIRFTGGEPLLLKGLKELIAQAAAAQVRVSVISNGRLLASKVRELADAGCDEIVLSIDAVGSVHDQIRDTPGLYDRCVAGLDAIEHTSMTYGVNTVVQRVNINMVDAIGDLLLQRRRLPTWWHLIPVRDHPELAPTPDQVASFQQHLPSMVERLSARAVRVVADGNMFGHHGPTPCTVPQFAAYVRADSGEVFGCNMLAYSGGQIGNIALTPPEQVWTNTSAVALRQRCQNGTNAGCARCDPASRAMNHLLGDLAP